LLQFVEVYKWLISKLVGYNFLKGSTACLGPREQEGPGDVGVVLGIGAPFQDLYVVVRGLAVVLPLDLLVPHRIIL
jgi:hypothetical protein